jgi:hypothetical protein
MYQKDMEVDRRWGRRATTASSHDSQFIPPTTSNTKAPTDQPSNNDIPHNFLGPNSIYNPVSTDDAVMILGNYDTGAKKNLYVEHATSKDDSFMIAAHVGASGHHRHVKPRAGGRSIMILGDVRESINLRDIEQKFETAKRPSKTST